MPHCTIEYTANIENQLNTQVMLQKVTDSLVSHQGEFNAEGIRSRAIMLTDYKIGHGTNQDAFIHVSLEIATGRSPELKQTIQDHLFTTLKDYVDHLNISPNPTLSLHLTELNDSGNLYSQT